MADFFPPLDRLRLSPDGRLTPDALRTLNRLVEIVNSLGRMDATPPLQVTYSEAEGPRLDFTAELGFPARLTGQFTDPVTGAKLPSYAWVEQTFNPDGSTADDPAGRTDQGGQFPLVEVNGNAGLPWAAAPVVVFARPGFGENLTYSFDATESTQSLRVALGTPYHERWRAKLQAYDPRARAWLDAAVPDVWLVTPNTVAPVVGRCTGRFAGLLASPVFWQTSSSSPAAGPAATLAVDDATGVNPGDTVLVKDALHSELALVTAVSGTSITVQELKNAYATPQVSLYSQAATASGLTFALPFTEDLLVGDLIEVSGDGNVEQTFIESVTDGASITVHHLEHSYTSAQVRTLDRLVFELAYDEVQWLRVLGPGIGANHYQPARVEYLPHGTTAGIDLTRDAKRGPQPVNVWAYNPNQPGYPLGFGHVRGRLVDRTDGGTAQALADVAAGADVAIPFDTSADLGELVLPGDVVTVTDSADPTIHEDAAVTDVAADHVTVDRLLNNYTTPYVTFAGRLVFLILPHTIVDWVTPTGPPDGDGLYPAQVQSQDTTDLSWSTVAPCLLEKANP